MIRQLKSTLFLALLTAISGLHAQDYSTGLTPPSDEYLKKAPKLQLVGEGEDLPENFDLKRYLPPVGDQGAQGSCAAWAGGYAMSSYFLGVERGHNLQTFDASKIMSPAFVYSLRPRRSSSGMTLQELFSIISGTGNIPWSLLPYNDDKDPVIDMARFRPIASQNKVPSYSHLYDWLSTDAQGNRQNIREEPLTNLFKQAIYQGTPLIVGICANLRFQLLGKNLRKRFSKETANAMAQKLGEDEIPIYWDEENIDVCGDMKKQIQSGVTPNPLESIGGHAVLIIGWDDEIGPNGSFLVMNSWGKDWGEDGYGWIDYNSIKEVIMQAMTTTRIPQFRAPPKPRPSFVEIAEVDESKWELGFNRVRKGMRFDEVFELVGGPTNAKSIRFVKGRTAILPEDSDVAGVPVWIYDSAEKGMLANISWKAGRVEASIIRKQIKAPEEKPELVEARWQDIQNGMSYERVFQIIGGPVRDHIQLLPNSNRLADQTLKFFGPDKKYQIRIEFQDGKVIDVYKWYRGNFPDNDRVKVDANFSQIRTRMRPQQVHDLLGGPYLHHFMFYGVDRRGLPADEAWEYFGSDGLRVKIQWQDGLVNDYLAYRTEFNEPGTKGVDPKKASEGLNQLRKGLWPFQVQTLLGKPRRLYKSGAGSAPLDFGASELLNTEWVYELDSHDERLLLRWKDGKLDDWEVVKVKK